MHRNEIEPPLVPLYDEMTKLFDKLFDELNNMDFLRKGPRLSHHDRAILVKIWQMTRNFGQALNFIFRLFEPNKGVILSDAFAQLGFTKDYQVSFWAQSMLCNFLINVESVFRFTMIFFLNDKFLHGRLMTLSSLINKLEKVYPPVAKLNQTFNIELRNSLAHGGFWLEPGTWCITTDPHLGLASIKRLNLVELFKIVKSANVATMAFQDVLNKKIRAGVFRA